MCAEFVDDMSKKDFHSVAPLPLIQSCQDLLFFLVPQWEKERDSISFSHGEGERNLGVGVKFWEPFFPLLLLFVG